MRQLILCFCIITITLQLYPQQNPNGIPNYNSILGIQANNLMEDFSLVPDMSNGNINYPILVSNSLLSQKIGASLDDFFVLKTNEYLFNKEKLTQDKYLSYGFSGKGELQFSTIRKYNYNEDGRLSDFGYYDNEVFVGEKTVYTYFPNGNIKSKTEIVKDRDDLVKNFKQLTNGNLETDNIKHRKEYFIVSTLGKKVRQVKTFNKDNNSNTEIWYGYEDDVSATINKVTFKSEVQEVVYKYKTGRRLTQVTITDLKENSTKHKLYYYVDDSYGNWIIRQEKFKGNDLDIYDKMSNKVHIRQIKYENGTVTGFLKPEGDAFKKALEEVNTKVFYDRNKDFDVPQNGAAWKKNGDGSKYWFYIDGEVVIDDCKPFLFEKDLYVFNKKTSELFLAKNFVLEEGDKYHKADKISDVSQTSGLWFKNENGNFFIRNIKGENISISDKRWAKNNKDFVVFGEREKGEQYLLKDYKNALPNVVYEAKMYHEKGDLADTEATSHSSSKGLTENMDALMKEALGDCVKGDCNNGFGKREWKDGRIFEGFFENGQANGPGVFTSTDESQVFSTYNGSYKLKIGFIYNYVAKSGTTEYFDMQNNLAFINESKPEPRLYSVDLNAKTRTWAQSNNSDTCIVGNCQNGVGVYRYSNGVIYLGTFSNGYRHGFGELTFTDGQFYIGEFDNGKKQGLGCYSWSKNKFYTGQWQNDKYHGKGVMMYDETSYNYQAGLWQNGQYIKSLDGVSGSTQNEINTNPISTSNYKLSEIEKTALLKCKDESYCLTKVFDDKYIELKKTISGEELIQRFTDYTLALNQFKPGQLFGIFMKSDYAVSSGILDRIPKEVKDNLQKEAQEVMDGYNKHINSKETREAVKKHGGTMNHGN